MHNSQANDSSTVKEAGFSLIEVTIAMALAAFGALTLLATLGTASHSDTSAKSRTNAAEAAHAVMQDILADADELEIDDFLIKWQDPANQLLEVDGLEDPDRPGNAAPIVIAVDDADPDRIAITVTVTWSDRGRSESLTVPYTLTETLK